MKGKNTRYKKIDCELCIGGGAICVIDSVVYILFWKSCNLVGPIMMLPFFVHRVQSSGIESWSLLLFITTTKFLN